MADNDTYAAKEAVRAARYREAYESEEAKRWINSISPAERERAEALGLLQAKIDNDVTSRSIDTLPAKMEPREQQSYDDRLIAKPLRKRQGFGISMDDILEKLGMQEADELEAFLYQDGNPRLRQACLCYLLNQGSATCEDFASDLGMSKQAFHYHVRQVGKQLGLPPMGNQRQEKARQTYRLTNRRK